MQENFQLCYHPSMKIYSSIIFYISKTLSIASQNHNYLCYTWANEVLARMS